MASSERSQQMEAVSDSKEEFRPRSGRRQRVFGSMDPKSAGCRSTKTRHRKSYGTTFLLAYQSLGVVYGDLSISPIYVYSNTFSGKLRLHDDDTEIFGVFSLVFWTLTVIALFKYIIIVLGADDHGEGGTFALYSRLCWNSKFGLIKTPNAAYGHFVAHESQTPYKETSSSLMIKSFFEKHKKPRIALFFVVLLGTSMLVSDGVLTPTMSVLSAMSGLRVKAPGLHENYTIIISCFLLLGLFTLQHYGTHRVGFLFAPVLIAWVGCLSMMGIYNIFKWNPGVVYALSPHYIYKFLKFSSKDCWSSLGGVLLCITGAEAMYAGLGHFSKLSLRMAFVMLIYPSLVLAYMGETAFLSMHKQDLQTSFHRSIPEIIFWPVFIVATLATIVGSQASISATFSLISQCRALNCFPWVKVMHTSNHVHGQIYIPEVNWSLMLVCLAITVGFKNTTTIGNAYGLAVISVMFVTTCLTFLIITTVWNGNIFLALLFTISFGSVEIIFFSASLSKAPHGGWLPLLLSVILLTVMASWHYVTSKKLAYEHQSELQLDSIISFGSELGLARVPGIGLVYSSALTGIPPIFAHFITNFPAFHRVVIFISIQTVTVSRVPVEERFLVSRVGPPEYGLFRCIVRYGFKDVRPDASDFEDLLLFRIAEFLEQEDRDKVAAKGGMSLTDPPSDHLIVAVSSADESTEDKSKTMGSSEEITLRREVREFFEQKELGVAYMMGNTSVEAHESSSLMKKIVIFLYGFLHRNCRRQSVAFGVPHSSLIEVGMVYRV